MKNSNRLMLAILIIPWLTVPLLGKKAFKKYYPSALLICIFTKVIDIFGEKRKWWRFYEGIPPLDSMNFFNFGPYFVSSLWVLKLAYGRFYTYLISNTILHVCFIYFGGLKLAKRFKIFSLNKLSKFQYLTIDFLRALLLYSFQYIIGLRHKNLLKG